MYRDKLQGVVIASRRYKDELLEACLEMLLSAPIAEGWPPEGLSTCLPGLGGVPLPCLLIDVLVSRDVPR